MAKKTSNNELNMTVVDLFADESETRSEAIFEPQMTKIEATAEDTESKLATKDALELARENYRDYGLYVGSGRAYPCIIDGANVLFMVCGKIHLVILLKLQN